MGELEVGNRVEQFFYGSGIVVETGLFLGGDPFSADLATVHFDTGAVLDINVKTLSKCTTKSPIKPKVKNKPKVKKWRWVYGELNSSELYISVDMYSEEEVKIALSAFRIIEKLDSTEKEFDK